MVALAIPGMAAIGSSVVQGAAAAVAPIAGSVLQKVVTLLVFVVLAALVWAGYMILNHTPPRSWTLSHVGDETAREIMDKALGMIVRLDEEYGAEIAAWLEGERAASTNVYRQIVAEWHVRADESYITRTYMMANTGLAREGEKSCGGLMGAACEDGAGGGDASGCERPPATADAETMQRFADMDVTPKDFEEPVFEECPRTGAPPCYQVSNADRRRAGDLFFGTPRPLDLASLRDDFAVWFNLVENDPVKPVMEADKPMLRSIENVELFLASLPWFMRHVQPRYAVFKYCTPEEAVASRAWIRASGASGASGGARGERESRAPLFIAKYLVFKGDPAARRDLECRMAGSVRVVDMALEALFESVVEDPVLVREYIANTDVKANQDLDNRADLKAGILARLATRVGGPDSPLALAHACLKQLRVAESEMLEAGSRVAAGNMVAARTKAHDASMDFSVAIDRLVALKRATDSRLNLVSLAAYPTVERLKREWDDILDLLNYDEEDIEDAYRAVETIDERDVFQKCLDGDEDRTSVLERDYRRYINLVHAVVYTGTYVAESKKYANIYHLNREVAKRFYEIVYSDLSCAYLSKFTFKPHESETGLVYNVQSIPEFAFNFWNWKERLAALQERLNAVREGATKMCGF